MKDRDRRIEKALGRSRRHEHVGMLVTKPGDNVPALVASLEREGRIAPGHGVIVVPDDLSMDAWAAVAAAMRLGRMGSR